jgi:hypothetical protein
MDLHGFSFFDGMYEDLSIFLSISVSISVYYMQYIYIYTYIQHAYLLYVLSLGGPTRSSTGKVQLHRAEVSELLPLYSADLWMALCPGWVRWVLGVICHLYDICIDGPFIDGLPIKHGDCPWLC